MSVLVEDVSSRADMTEQLMANYLSVVRQFRNKAYEDAPGQPAGWAGLIAWVFSAWRFTT